MTVLGTSEQALAYLASVMPGRDFAVAHQFSLGWVCVPALSEDEIADGQAVGLVRVLVDKSSGQVWVYPSWPAAQVAQDYTEAHQTGRTPKARQLQPRAPSSSQPVKPPHQVRRVARVPTKASALFSDRFVKWAAHNNVSLNDLESGEVQINHKHWGRHVISLLDSGRALVTRDHSPRSPRFEVSAGDDLERVLYQRIGDEFRFQQLIWPIEYPEDLAHDWVATPQKQLLDPSGRWRFQAYGAWRPTALSHLLRVSPPKVARSYNNQRGMPLRRILARNRKRQFALLLVCAALVGGIYWASAAGDTALTVALFVLTGIPAATAMVAAAAGVLLNAVDANAPLRGRALGPVVAILGVLGVAVEIVTAYLAMRAAGDTWYYPLVALAVIAVAAVLIFIIGVLAD